MSALVIPDDYVREQSPRKRMSHAQRASRARLLYASKRDQIAAARDAKDWRNKRPDEWFAEQAGVLNEIADIGEELAFIAANASSYDAWKFSLTVREAAE